MKPVVPEGQRTRGGSADEYAAWKMGFLSGLAIAAVGTLDSALLLYPPNFASLDWEFGTISALIESMPLATLGFGAMAVAATAAGFRKWSWLVAITGLLVSLFVLAMLVIYTLDLPAAFRALQPAMKSPVRLTVFKTMLMGGTYVVLYATLGVWTWRRLKSLKGAS